MHIYYLGNAFIDEDSTAIHMAEELKDHYDFSKIDTFEDMLNVQEGSILIDVCKGVDRACLIEDIDRFLHERRTTAHDMDFGFFLKLRKELGEINTVKIICLPSKKYKSLKQDVLSILEGLS